MAYVYQAGVFTSIAINIGLADKQLQDELLLVAGTAASYTKTSRDFVATSLDSSSTNANTDATTILIQAFRNTETSLSTTLSPFYSSTIVSLNNYFSSIVGASFRDYFNSKTAATTIDFAPTSPASSATGYSNFRDTYRRTYSNEMIYRLYNYNSSSVLSSTAGTFGFAGSLLEIRKFSNSGTAGTITLSAIRTSDNGTDIIVLPINSGIATSYYNVVTTSGSNTRYSRVSAVSVNGFSSGAGAGAASTFEIWVR
jgi:hypothetical protein